MDAIEANRALFINTCSHGLCVLSDFYFAGGHRFFFKNLQGSNRLTVRIGMIAEGAVRQNVKNRWLNFFVLCGYSRAI